MAYGVVFIRDVGSIRRQARVDKPDVLLLREHFGDSGGAAEARDTLGEAMARGTELGHWRFSETAEYAVHVNLETMMVEGITLSEDLHDLRHVVTPY